MTFNGDTKLSITQKKFGATSLYSAGSGYVVIPQSVDFDFGSGPFTIECWIQLTTTSGFQIIASNAGDNMAGGWGLAVYVAGGGIRWANNSVLYDFSWSPSAGPWYHIAVVFDGSLLKIYVDGSSLSDGVSYSSTYSSVNNLWLFGRPGDGYYGFYGWIDELRISKGIARYTGPFVPTGPFNP